MSAPVSACTSLIVRSNTAARYGEKVNLSRSSSSGPLKQSPPEKDAARETRDDNGDNGAQTRPLGEKRLARHVPSVCTLTESADVHFRFARVPISDPCAPLAPPSPSRYTLLIC